MKNKDKTDNILDSLTFPAYEEVRESIDKKAGEKPSLPPDLDKGQWSEQSIKVLE